MIIIILNTLHYISVILIVTCCRTALHLACAKGHADIVKVLLEWHAKSNIGDGEEKTPLLKVHVVHVQSV